MKVNGTNYNKKENYLKLTNHSIKKGQVVLRQILRCQNKMCRRKNDSYTFPQKWQPSRIISLKNKMCRTFNYSCQSVKYLLQRQHGSRMGLSDIVVYATKKNLLGKKTVPLKLKLVRHSQYNSKAHQYTRKASQPDF